MKPAEIARDILFRLALVQAIMSLCFGYLIHPEFGNWHAFPWQLWGLQCLAIALAQLLFVAGLLFLRLFGLRMITLTLYYKGPADKAGLYILKGTIWVAWFTLCLMVMYQAYGYLTGRPTPQTIQDLLESNFMFFTAIGTAAFVIVAISRRVLRKLLPPKQLARKPSHLA